MGKFILVGLLAFAVALSGTAYAEVQNVKVGGDIDMKVISHNNYDLKNKQLNVNNPPGGNLGTGTSTPTNSDSANFFLSTVRVTVDADLTDNVATHVRLLNQRIWNADTSATGNIDIDNAYVVLKEFLYSPLTLIVGRQDLKYGTGFIVGPGILADPQGAFASAPFTTGSQNQLGREYSAFNSYDAVRAILDFSPVTLEAVYAKIQETGVARDDEDLIGAIVNYKLNRWNAEIEPYWFYKNNESVAAGTAALSTGAGIAGEGTFRDDIGIAAFNVNRVHTFGSRATGSPIENLWVNLEGAYQVGELEYKALQLQRIRHAWAGQADVRYTWAQVPWTPNTGAGWVYFAGHHTIDPNALQANQQQLTRYQGWDPMFRGQFYTYIQDFLGGYGANNLYTTFDANDTAANTNRQLGYVDLTLKPLRDLTLWGRYTHVWFARRPVLGRSGEAGQEIDMKASYAYTEDVSLEVGGGGFFPGRYYSKANSNARGADVAWTLVGSAKVKF